MLWPVPNRWPVFKLDWHRRPTAQQLRQFKLLRASKSVVESVRGVQVVECLNLSDFGPWFKSCRSVEVADWPPVTANREVGYVERRTDHPPQLHMWLSVRLSQSLQRNMSKRRTEPGHFWPARASPLGLGGALCIFCHSAAAGWLIEAGKTKLL